jgi:hypothetical protein
MIRLHEPNFSFEHTLDTCANGITGNDELHKKFVAAKFQLLAAGALYVQAANAGTLYAIEPIDTINDADPVVIANLRKSELVKIYSQYLVNTNKSARRIYDALLNAAQESCPFCGGIGTPRNLDHFLPKTYFPQFAIFPKNLVPSCRDCNMDGKGQTYAKSADAQLIQPYVDHDRFFFTQWIFANYHPSENEEPGYIEYYVDPPTEWDTHDKAKVKKHFLDFNLAKRYGTKAGQQLNTVLRQMRSFRDHGLDSEIKSTLLMPGIEQALFVNHWQRGMYQALMASLP